MWTERFRNLRLSCFLKFEKGTFIIKLCFRYRKYKLGNDIELVVRCEHDAVTYGPSGELAMMNIKSLNEWDSRVGL